MAFSIISLMCIIFTSPIEIPDKPRLWEKIVKIGLGYDINLYAMKKAGANAKILAGMSIRTLKEMFGHSSELTTEIYITNLKEIMHKEMLDISPEF